MDRDSELALVARLRAGDPAAFDEVFDEHRARVFGFLLRLTRHRDVAEDLLEEVWLRLVSHARRLDPDTRLAPWLFTVARNLYWSYRRVQALERDATSSLIGVWPSRAALPSPFEEAAAKELDARLDSALVALPAIYREVLWLVGVEDMAPAEAATVCGVSSDAMRQRLSRARAMLAETLQLEPHGGKQS